MDPARADVEQARRTRPAAADNPGNTRLPAGPGLERGAPDGAAAVGAVQDPAPPAPPVADLWRACRSRLESGAVGREALCAAMAEAGARGTIAPRATIVRNAAAAAVSDNWLHLQCTATGYGFVVCYVSTRSIRTHGTCACT
mgnify:CR=1 FL=1